MDCKTIKELLSPYIDGELDADVAREVERHLVSCEDCALELELLKRTLEMCQELDEVEVPSGFSASVMQKVRSKHTVRGVFARLNSLLNTGPRRALAYAALALVLVVGANSVLGISPRGLGLSGFGFSAKSAVTEDAGQFEAPMQAPAPMVAAGYAEDGMVLGSRSRESVSSEKALMAGGGTSVFDAAAVIERQIIRRASLQIETGKERFDEAGREVVTVVETIGGFVQDSSVYTEADGQRISNFSLRVPTESFAKTLTRFETLGRVVTQETGSQDVTEQVIDLDAQLNNREKQHSRMLELMGQAKTLDEILRIENELSRLRTEIDSYRGRLQYLQNQVSMSSIYLTLRESASKLVPESPSVWRDVWNAFVRSARAIVIFCGEAIPYLGAAWFVWFLVATYRKK